MSKLKIPFFICLFFLITACSCKGRLNGWMGENGKLKILSTTAQIGDLVKEIGGDRIDGWILIQGDLDPHSYELVKGDGEKFDRADRIFFNGLGLEHGASLSHLLHSSPKAVSIGDAIQKNSPERILKKGGTVDPHIWMDITLWSEGVSPIVEELSLLDPDGASFYRERGEALIQKMVSVHKKIFEKLHSVPSEKRYLVTSHDAFHYFTRGYLADEGETNWGERFAAPEGLAPDGQLSPFDIRKTINYLREKKISVLFPESNVSRDSIKKIASAGSELGLQIKICTEALYGDSTGGLSYLDMMEQNAETLAKYLE